jgi:hypothetical protein
LAISLTGMRALRIISWMILLSNSSMSSHFLSVLVNEHNKNKIKQINLVWHYKTENPFIFCAYAELF